MRPIVCVVLAAVALVANVNPAAAVPLKCRPRTTTTTDCSKTVSETTSLVLPSEPITTTTTTEVETPVTTTTTEVETPSPSAETTTTTEVETPSPSIEPTTTTTVSICTATPAPSLAKSVTFNGKTYINKGLVAFGRVPNALVDSFGETLGGWGSAIALTSFTSNADCTYTGTLLAQPDRGHNTNGTTNYRSRHHVFNFKFNPYNDADVFTVANKTRENFEMKYESTLLYSDFNGTDTTGLDPDAIFGANAVHGDLPRVAALDALPVDAEGLVVADDSGYFVSDEYGPAIYKTDAAGKMQYALFVPAAIIPRDATGAVNFNTAKDPKTGRRTNQGFEGMTVDNTNKALWVLLQSATMQDGGSRGATRRHTRLLKYDLSAGSAVIPPLVAEYVVPLPFASVGGSVAAQSELHIVSANTFLVLSRDGAGQGDTNLLSTYKQADLVDVSKATNILGTVFDSPSGAVSPAGVLDSGIVPADYTSFVDFIDPVGLARFGLHNGAPLDDTLIGAKWEGLSIVSVNDPAYPEDYFLFAAQDNDFITKTGFMTKDKIPYVDAYPQGVDPQMFVFRVTLPGYNQPALPSK